MARKLSMVPVERIESAILRIRGHNVMLDAALSRLYGVQVKRLLEAIKRNIKRFPADFMFQLTRKESKNLRSQFATSSWGGRRYLPYVFTEQGVAMLSSVLHSDKAIEVNIEIMRAFVHLRKILATNKDLARKVEELEKKYGIHDIQIKQIFHAIRQLIELPEPKPERRIGFRQRG